ncbi:Pentatricopeptide repeat-containing protein [Vitis vinifera]|uniref:Pentatricopeptide repeat-containing protein n=1 Tax=Vitis vinifera TaxID=29760 RepID=A0A438CVB6_VITVI|nr:Pentatricopeptide repeat-containing protein [Vitis vinifera]
MKVLLSSLMLELICGCCRQALAPLVSQLPLSLLAYDVSLGLQTWAITQILLYMKDNFLVLRYPVYLEALQTLKVAGESDILLRQVNPHLNVGLSSKEEIVEFKETVADNQWCIIGFEYSVKMGINIERIAYLALMGVFIRANSFPKVADIVEKMVRAGISLGMYLGALLIYRLGCARRPGSAAKVFGLLPDDQKGTAAYTALISAYFSLEMLTKDLKFTKTMQRKRIHPALGTYNLLLAGLEKKG